jgi:hypothetical protein
VLAFPAVLRDAETDLLRRRRSRGGSTPGCGSNTDPNQDVHSTSHDEPHGVETYLFVSFAYKFPPSPRQKAVTMELAEEDSTEEV